MDDEKTLNEGFLTTNQMYESLFGEPPPQEGGAPPSEEFDGADVLYQKFVEQSIFPAQSVKLNSWRNFSDMTGGFRPREFTILCGATGVGKTTLLANWSAQLHLQGEPHFIASVETGATDFIARVVSALDHQNWNTGKPIPFETMRALNQKHQSIITKPYMWLARYEDRTEVDALMGTISLAMKKHKVKIAMIDNLNFFMEVTNAANMIVEMDRVIHDLIIFCKKNDIHIIMVMHPRKMENGRVESEFDIKGSSTAVQEAHNVFLFNRPTKEAIEQGLANASDRELSLAKIRRFGEHVGSKIFLSTINGVKYAEKKIWTL